MGRKSGFENHRLRTLIWIVRKLQRGPKSLRELNELWVDDESLSGGNEIERRTFNNYVRAIWDLFHIDIECQLHNDYRYKIVSAEVSPVTSHLMDNFEQMTALGNSRNLEDRVVVDKAPCGAEFLEKIMEAMEKSRKITIDFHNFNTEEGFSITGAPYCVKLYQQRWYVVIREDDNYIDTYSLDRITNLEIKKEKFVIDPKFNAEEFFRYSFGVRVNLEEEPSLIMLKVKDVQREYFRTLPLHASQREIVTEDEYSIFTLEVVPSIELTMKIMSYGFLVEVLEPGFLREVVMEEVKSLYNTYFT